MPHALLGCGAQDIFGHSKANIEDSCDMFRREDRVTRFAVKLSNHGAGRCSGVDAINDTFNIHLLGVAKGVGDEVRLIHVMVTIEVMRHVGLNSLYETVDLISWMSRPTSWHD